MKQQISMVVFFCLMIGLNGCQAIDTTMIEHSGEMEHRSNQTAKTERQSEVAEKGAEVMPFDLDATTHIFEKNDEGGLQQVIVDSPDDTEQIALIRTHLAEEATRFQQGDFHDPQMIHGDNMAGLHALMISADEIEITYSELPDGAQILYTTTDTALVDAIHDWFDAQLADHGAHATDHR